jgi:hypothetical protein
MKHLSLALKCICLHFSYFSVFFLTQGLALGRQALYLFTPAPRPFALHVLRLGLALLLEVVLDFGILTSVSQASGIAGRYHLAQLVCDTVPHLLRLNHCHLLSREHCRHAPSWIFS